MNYISLPLLISALFIWRANSLSIATATTTGLSTCPTRDPSLCYTCQEGSSQTIFDNGIDCPYCGCKTNALPTALPATCPPIPDFCPVCMAGFIPTLALFRGCVACICTQRWECSILGPGADDCPPNPPPVPTLTTPIPPTSPTPPSP